MILSPGIFCWLSSTCPGEELRFSPFKEASGWHVHHKLRLNSKLPQPQSQCRPCEIKMCVCVCKVCLTSSKAIFNSYRYLWIFICLMIFHLIELKDQREKKSRPGIPKKWVPDREVSLFWNFCSRVSHVASYLQRCSDLTSLGKVLGILQSRIQDCDCFEYPSWSVSILQRL